MPAVKFTEPALCHYNHDLKKSWFVYFDVSNGNKTIRMQSRRGLNRIKNLNERLHDGKILALYWKEKLKEGWSPFEQEEKLTAMDLEQALNFALAECKVATATHRAYRLCIKYVIAAAKACKLDHYQITSIERLHIKLILKKCVEKYKWSNKRYNNNHRYLCAIMGRLVDWEIIKFNPAEKIKSLPVTETQKYIPYNTEEKEKIREYFYLNHYRYYVILMIIFHMGMRPKEVLALKIKDVDLDARLISIYPEIELENSKTKKIRKVPVNNHLLPFLRELQLENYQGNYYVFGSSYRKGAGNRGSSKGGKSGAMHPDYFKPSATMIKRDTITRFWKKIVMDKLGINKYQYAMKHTGGDAKILAGMKLDALKELYGHSSKFMTEKYARVIKEVYKKHIIEHSPEF